MSPEYAVHGLFSTKSDIFSFGVVMLEIISGQRNRTLANLDHSLNLLGYVRNCILLMISYPNLLTLSFQMEVLN